VTLATLAGGYQWWLLSSDFAQVMYRTVVLNPRVREEFGTGVEARALIGWSLDDTAFLFGPVWGKENWGYVSASMQRSNGQWSFPELRVHDVCVLRSVRRNHLRSRTVAGRIPSRSK
jgi:hypothetical protein